VLGLLKRRFIDGRIDQTGEEKQPFEFGGCCVITGFQPSRIKFENDLGQPSCEYREVSAKMSEVLGRAVS